MTNHNKTLLKFKDALLQSATAISHTNGDADIHYKQKLFESVIQSKVLLLLYGLLQILGLANTSTRSSYISRGNRLL